MQNKIEQNMKQIEEVIQRYFKGYLSADASTISEVFYDQTRLYAVSEDRLQETLMSNWLINLNERKSKGDVRSAETQIVSIDVGPRMAIAKVQLKFEKFKFTDHLSLLKVGQKWKIYAKVYDVENL